jgi:hypothetical protein
MALEFPVSKCIATFLISILVAGARQAAADGDYPPVDPRTKTDIKHVEAYFAALGDEQQGHYASMHLAELGPTIVPRVVDALRSEHPVVREYAVRTLSQMGAEKAAAARGAVAAALAREKNERTLWSMVQAAGVLKCEPRDAVPVLLKVLEHPSVDLRRMAAEAIGELGPGAGAAKSGLVKSIENTPDDWFQKTVVRALRKIGIDTADAAALARAKVGDNSEGAREIFRELVRGYPELATAYLADHPKLLAGMPADDLALIDLFARDDATSAGLRASLGRRTDLPPFVRVDYAKGERVGRALAYPRNPDPTECFPQRLPVVRVEPGAKHGDAGRAVFDRFANDPVLKLWESEGLVMVVIDEKWGFADAVNGRVVIEPQFDYANNFAGGRAVVAVGEKYGYVDKAGRLLVRPQFEWGYAFSKGMAAVKQNGKFGLIDADGRWVKEPTYKRIDPWVDGWKGWTFDGMEGMLDAKGEIVSPKRSQE